MIQATFAKGLARLALPGLLLLAALTAGCGSHLITSKPTGAMVYALHAGQEPKPSPEELTSFERPTPFTMVGGPFDHWYQVRLDGYEDSEVVFLPSQVWSGVRSHEFVLKPLAAAPAPVPVAAGAGVILAVFDVEDVAELLQPKEREQLQDFLATRLTELAGYKVVPREQLRQRLLEQKAESYRPCFDEACQIELGKEISAQKTVATRILKVGASCVLTAKLYDLRSATAEKAASARVECSAEKLLDGMDQLAKQLAAP